MRAPRGVIPGALPYSAFYAGDFDGDGADDVFLSQSFFPTAVGIPSYGNGRRDRDVTRTVTLPWSYLSISCRLHARYWRRDRGRRRPRAPSPPFERR